jgi:UDP-glucose 4-epimerase
VPVPAFTLGTLGSFLPQARQADLSTEQASFLTYGRCVDTRAMREVLGFEPSATTASAFEDFARRLRTGALDRQRLADLERHVSSLIRKVLPHGGR